MYDFIELQKYYILVSKSQTKLITSLQHKKYREQTGLFVAEGPKVIAELLKEGMVLEALYATENPHIIEKNHFQVTETELKRLSFLKTPNSAVAIFQIPKAKKLVEKDLIMALDSVRDPGNLGTIIRLCDWFGVRQLVCSEDTTDCYNPKTVQATMGSLPRVQVHYLSLPDFFEATTLPIYGGFMEGKNVYSEQLPKAAILVMGNEANGISSEVASKISNKISIPRFGETQRAESLNVATATAILLSEFRRGY